jgi:uncharacterized membrane protein YhaH (DUF805 family)
MSFGDAISTCFRKYATVSGRAHRPEYWWFFLFTTIVSVVASLADYATDQTWTASGYGPISTVAALALLLPSIAVGARRLHDTGRSGWWQLLCLIPCVGVIVLIVMLCQQGQPHPNKYDELPTY